VLNVVKRVCKNIDVFPLILVKEKNILEQYMKYSKRIENRVSRIEGQIGGVKRMMKSNAEEDKVMTQLQAVISSLESLKLEMIRKQMKETLVDDIRKSLGLSDA